MAASLVRTVWIVLLAASVPVCRAQLLDGDDDDMEGLGLEDLFQQAPDYELLGKSHFSEVFRWAGVAGAKTADVANDAPARWEVAPVPNYFRFAAVMGTSPFPSRAFVKPVSDEPISTRMTVPEDGEYRVWLGYMAKPGEARPVTLALSGASRLSHVFGAMVLPQAKRGELEQEFPLRFDSEFDATRFGFTGDNGVVWEYKDMPLKAGGTVLSLQSDCAEARVDSVFVAQSKAFTPSKAMYLPASEENEATLNRVYYRFRIKEADASTRSAKVTSFVRYKTPHYRRGHEERIFYGSFASSSTVGFPTEDGRSRLPIGVWSKWLDETELVTSAGTYGNCRLTVVGSAGGTIEAQMAWYPHPAAAVRTIQARVHAGRTLFMFPVDSHGYAPPEVGDADGEAPWGVMDPGYVGRLESEGDALAKVVALMNTDEIQACPPLKKIKLYTGFGVSPPYIDTVAPALARLGVNWLRLPMAARRKYGLAEEHMLYQQGSIVHARIHCPLDPTFETWVEGWAEETATKMEKDDPEIRTRSNYLKMGDEIGPIAGPDFVNGLPDCRAAFHDYLREQLESIGEDASFFGVADLADVDFTLTRTADMGRYERRAYYHSARFNWVLTAKYYERFTRAARKVFPNLLTGCNHTPGGFMFGGDMSTSSWFGLARHGGSNTALAEGWIRTRGRYAFAATQSTGYYAEILDCAARPFDLPKAFYLVGGCGDIDRKLVSLVARDIHLIHLYDWGPAYLGGDSFSDVAWAYPQINRGARALAPVEDIVVDGDREPRRVAMVYNETHEFWHKGSMGIYVDRLFTFLALQHAHLPVDVVLEDDLTAENLARYAIVYLNGFNIPRESVLALRKWVEGGGVLYGTVGSAMRDEYDDPIPETVELFGASQRIDGVSKSNWYYSQWWPIGLRTHKPIDTVQVLASALTPELSVDVVGVRATLTPTTGTPVATFADGSCAGVIQDLGKGKTLLLGLAPGDLYCHNAPLDWEEPYVNAHPTNYTADRRGLIALAAQNVLGPPKAQYTEPLVEVSLFEHPERGIAVLLSDYTYDPGRAAELSVKTDREIGQVVSSLQGPLKWERKGERIVIPLPVPDPVDVIALRFKAPK